MFLRLILLNQSIELSLDHDLGAILVANEPNGMYSSLYLVLPFP